MRRFTFDEITEMPVIDVGHCDNLILEHPSGIKVWRSRLTVADGMPYNNQITVEKRDNLTGKWSVIDTYRPVGSPTDIAAVK